MYYVVSDYCTAHVGCPVSRADAAHVPCHGRCVLAVWANSACAANTLTRKCGYPHAKIQHLADKYKHTVHFLRILPTFAFLAAFVAAAAAVGRHGFARPQRHAAARCVACRITHWLTVRCETGRFGVWNGPFRAAFRPISLGKTAHIAHHCRTPDGRTVADIRKAEHDFTTTPRLT